MRWLVRPVLSMCVLRRRGLSDLVGEGPRARYTEGNHKKIILSGVLAWFGLSQESESEHDLIITIKRGILAAQVSRYFLPQT